MKRFQNKIRNVLPAYKRQPDLYYSHVWLDREIYAQNSKPLSDGKGRKKYSVRWLFAYYSSWGLKRYVLEQINLAAKEENRARAEAMSRGPTDFIKDMRKKIQKDGLPPIVELPRVCMSNGKIAISL